MRCALEFLKTFTGNAVLLGLFLITVLLVVPARAENTLIGGLVALFMLGVGTHAELPQLHMGGGRR